MKVIILGTGDIALEVLRKLQDDVRINVLGVICDASVKYEANELDEELLSFICFLRLAERALSFSSDVIYPCSHINSRTVSLLSLEALPL